ARPREARPAAPFENTLALQKAMVMARSYLRMDDPKRAVEVLERSLEYANGNSTYLELLRDAYRAYIKDLGLKNQGGAAQVYSQRLVLLGQSPNDDPIQRPEPKFVPPAPVQKAPAFPDFAFTQRKQSPPPKIDVVRDLGVRETHA